MLSLSFLCLFILFTDYNSQIEIGDSVKILHSDSNLTYSYYNPETGEVTTIDSGIPLYNVNE